MILKLNKLPGCRGAGLPGWSTRRWPERAPMAREGAGEAGEAEAVLPGIRSSRGAGGAT